MPGAAKDYNRMMLIHAAIAPAFEAIATIGGLKGWWTSRVSGSDAPGGVIRLEFAGMDEHIDMEVVLLRPPFEGAWRIVEHSSLPEWAGTRLHFELRPQGEAACNLSFRHEGLSPGLDCYDDCRLGWDHFLGSIAALAETGRGHPFGS